MSRPLLVSVIVPTYNSATTLDACLKSITAQDYKDIELVVIDNNSTDDTKKIAKKHTRLVFNKGPERSAQRNFGVHKAKGHYVLIIDSDMELSDSVVKACVDKIKEESTTKALIIPEESFGIGFWAQCKKLERSFYVGVEDIEAARFFEKSFYEQLGGYDEAMVSGEDWDLSKRAAMVTKIDRIDELIFHDEGKLKLIKTLKKKYYYARLSGPYLQKQNVTSKLNSQTGPVQRYKLFFSNPGKLFRNPIVGIGMLSLKTAEYTSGYIGFTMSRPPRKESFPND